VGKGAEFIINEVLYHVARTVQALAKDLDFSLLLAAWPFFAAPKMFMPPSLF
jgi:hypothetical protein